MKSSSMKSRLLTEVLGTIFLCSILIFASCKKDSSSTPPVVVDKSALQAAIAIAQGLNDNTTEGTKPGDYEVGSKAALTTALNASKTVNADANATQTTVNNTTAQLNAAIATYESHLIKEIAAANLIGFWKMNGNADDSSGNGNNGTLTAGHPYFGAGTVTPTIDRFGRANMAYHFDHGANIDVPYKASLNPAQMTISLWEKWTSTGRTLNTDTYTFLAMNRWNGYKFQLQSGHLPFYTVKVVKPAGDTTIYDRDDAGVALAENEWHHVVVTFTSGVENFYIDGDLVKTWDATTPNPVPGNAITLPQPIDFVIGQDLPTNKYLTVDDGTGNFFVNYGGFFTGLSSTLGS